MTLPEYLGGWLAQFSKGARHFTADDVYVSSLQGYMEGLHGGVTSSLDHAHNNWPGKYISSHPVSILIRVVDDGHTSPIQTCGHNLHSEKNVPSFSRMPRSYATMKCASYESRTSSSPSPQNPNAISATAKKAVAKSCRKPLLDWTQMGLFFWGDMLYQARLWL